VLPKRLTKVVLLLQDRPWYGSDGVLEQWVDYLSADLSSEERVGNLSAKASRHVEEETQKLGP
jgi:hypothetical protein